MCPSNDPAITQQLSWQRVKCVGGGSREAHSTLASLVASCLACYRPGNRPPQATQHLSWPATKLARVRRASPCMPARTFADTLLGQNRVFAGTLCGDALEEAAGNRVGGWRAGGSRAGGGRREAGGGRREAGAAAPAANPPRCWRPSPPALPAASSWPTCSSTPAAGQRLRRPSCRRRLSRSRGRGSRANLSIGPGCWHKVGVRAGLRGSWRARIGCLAIGRCTNVHICPGDARHAYGALLRGLTGLRRVRHAPVGHRGRLSGRIGRGVSRMC